MTKATYENGKYKESILNRLGTGILQTSAWQQVFMEECYWSKGRNDQWKAYGKRFIATK